MSVVDGTVRTLGHTVSRAATATTAAAGAVGGATFSGVVGGVAGTATGVRRGVSTGRRSTPAAALTLGAVGVVGLIEWPLVVAVGGGALVLRRLGRPGNTVATPTAVHAKTTTKVTSTGRIARRSASSQQRGYRSPGR
jgi:hypothetical protein